MLSWKPRGKCVMVAFGGRGYRTIQRIYNDPEYIPTIPTLERIAKALGVSTRDLLEDLPDEPK